MAQKQDIIDRIIEMRKDPEFRRAIREFIKKTTHQ